MKHVQKQKKKNEGCLQKHSYLYLSERVDLPDLKKKTTENPFNNVDK